MSRIKTVNNKLLIGRSEWCALPQLNLPAIKAKVDTGAQTSAIHAFDINPLKQRGRWVAHFSIHPMQGNERLIRRCKAPIIDQRNVMSSNGHKENRYVIESTLILGGHEWTIQLTLSNRDPLRYRMLLGLEALKHRVVIDPNLQCNQQKLSRDKVSSLYHPQG